MVGNFTRDSLFLRFFFKSRAIEIVNLCCPRQANAFQCGNTLNYLTPVETSQSVCLWRLLLNFWNLDPLHENLYPWKLPTIRYCIWLLHTKKEFTFCNWTCSYMCMSRQNITTVHATCTLWCSACLCKCVEIQDLNAIGEIGRWGSLNTLFLDAPRLLLYVANCTT